MGDVSLRKVTLAAGERVLLSALDFDIIGGELCAVVGPNGVGKTTLLRTLAGEKHPMAGTVRVAGRDPHGLPPARRARVVTMVAEVEAPGAMSVEDFVATARVARRPWWDWNDDPSDRAAVDGALARVGLESFAQRAFETLSSGERQRAIIALALAQETPVVLFDEPTSHLDVRVALDVLQLLRGLADSGTTVVAVLHDLNQAAMIADRIALLGGGRLQAFARPEVVLGGPELDDVYGAKFERLRDSCGALRVVANASTFAR